MTFVGLPGGRTIAYECDANGNRAKTTDSPLGTTTCEANTLNQATRAGDASFYYDPDGNLIRLSDRTTVTNSTSDDRYQLVAAAGPPGVFAYDYNAFGNRRSMTVNGATTEFLIDPTSLVNMAAEHGRGAARDAAGHGLVSRVAAGGASYYNFDAVGLTDAAGSYANRYGHLPFGEGTTFRAAAPNLLRFVGRFGVQAPGGGLALMHFRNHSPRAGQFESDDLIGPARGDANIRR